MKIKTVLSEDEEANEMSRRAREKVSEYTWSARAQRILTYTRMTSI